MSELRGQGFKDMDSGVRVRDLGSGTWIQAPGSRDLGSGVWVQESELTDLGSGI